MQDLRNHSLGEVHKLLIICNAFRNYSRNFIKVLTKPFRIMFQCSSHITVVVIVVKVVMAVMVVIIFIMQSSSCVMLLLVFGFHVGS